jgi:hypothetical protein
VKDFKDHSKVQFLEDRYGYLQTFHRKKQRALFKYGNHEFVRFLGDKEFYDVMPEGTYVKSVWRLIPNETGGHS